MPLDKQHPATTFYLFIKKRHVKRHDLFEIYSRAGRYMSLNRLMQYEEDEQRFHDR